MESIYAVSLTMMKKLFLSGFGPFLDVKNNPSEVLVKKLAEHFNCAHIVLPVLFEQSYSLLKPEVEKNQPELLIMLGVASQRSKIGFEKIGLNWVQSISADAGHKIPTTGKIKPDQNLALMTDWSVDAALRELDPALMAHVEVSFSAGAYVCNDLYYRALDDRKLQCEKLFIHIPPFEKIDLEQQFKVIMSFIEITLQS